MKTIIAAVVLVAGLSAPASGVEVRCAAYSPQCGFPEAVPGATITEPVPRKCVKPKYRKTHLRKCGLR